MKCCSECKYWDATGYLKRVTDGYYEVICQQPEDERDRKYKRGSDNCSKWKAKQCMVIRFPHTNAESH